MMKITYNTKLQKLRKEAGISQKQLADVLNVSQTAIGFWERGERTPSVDSARKLADYFGVSTDDLFSPDDTDITLHKIKIPPTSLTKLYEETRIKKNICDEQRWQLLVQLSSFLDENNFTEEEFKNLEDYANYIVLKRERDRLAHFLDLPESKDGNKKPDTD